MAFALNRLRSTLTTPRDGLFPVISTTQKLQQLLLQLSRRPKPHLLDVGHLNGSNIEWLIQRGLKVHVDDCFRFVGKSGGVGFPDGVLRNLLSDAMKQYPTRFDAVLCWDLFDYLSSKQARELVERLSSLLKPKGLLFAFFNYSPSSPSGQVRYRISSETQLEYHTLPMDPLRRRVYENRDIQDLFSGFEGLNSCLLKNQIREVLVRKA